jgi:hypothetical protein
VSDNETDQIVRGVQVILLWDSSYLSLADLEHNGPYTWQFSAFFDDSPADGLNADCGPAVFCDPYTGLPYNDGNAYYQAGASFYEDAYATPEGLLVVSFVFDALAYTPATEVSIPGAFGEYTTTQVFGEEPGEEVTGTLGSAPVTVHPQVDWGVLAVDAPDAACGFYPGDTVTVLLTVSDLLSPINAVQSLIEFDADLLSLVGITPGDGSGSPWDSAVEIHEEVDAGVITYAVLLVAGESDADAVVATLEFTVLPSAGFQVGAVQLLAQVPPLLTELTLASTGDAIIPDLHGPAVIAHPGDGDSDGDVDLDDHGGLVSCLTGPGATGPLGDCCRFDFDRDEDVDLGDFGALVAVFTGV